MLLILILALPFAGSLIAALLPSDARNLEAWLAEIVALGSAAAVIALYPAVAHGGVVEITWPWIPAALEINFVLRLDGYAWLFTLLITLMGALIVPYAHYYLSPQDPARRFFAFLSLFMGSMLGIVLSGSLLQLVMFWELTSLSSLMLIAYWHHRLDSRRGARMAFLITSAGGLCLLAGVLMLGHIVGSYDLDIVLASGDLVLHHPWYPVILVLIALAALTKSAQFPFHIWLPNAMAAPTPVSAYLHSATMVMAGVFLLARFWPVLAGTSEWFWIIGGLGTCSLLLGGYAAMFQRDMKGVLAYSTISHLGLITLLIGMNSALGLVAAIFHMINHATFKASLFMAAGIVDHETGTRDMRRLSGLARLMPVTATLAVVAAAAMAGVPLLNGFLSKEMFFAETVFIDGNFYTEYVLPIAAIIAGIFSVAYSLRFINQVFFGPPATDLPRAAHEPAFWMLVPSGLLALACLIVGIFPRTTLGPLLNIATLSILGTNAPQYDLKIWHGFNRPLAMSIIALVGGIALYYVLLARRHMHPDKTPFIHSFDGRRSFEGLLEGMDSVFGWLLQKVYSPRLQRQLLLVILITLGAALTPLLQGKWVWAGPATPLDPSFIILWLVGGACAIGTALQAKYHRLSSLIMAGGAGLTTAITFAWLSAPDLALTQLAVETVTTVLILLGLRWLPPRVKRDDAGVTPPTLIRRSRDVVVAIAGGAGLAALAYAVLVRPKPDGISNFFIKHSLSEGNGANIVNVILVDFRGFDTLGEITVLGVVAITVYALLRRFRPPPETIPIDEPHRQLGINASLAAVRHKPPHPESPLPEGAMLVPAVLARFLLPIGALASLYFLLRGHDLPGGGFVGGLILATFVIVQYMVGGINWVESRQKVGPQYWIALGLLAAGAAAVAAWWSALPLLSAITLEATLPIIGNVLLPSVLLLDIGVYMLVVGATILMLVALAHQSSRFHRKVATPPTLSPHDGTR
ncbi:MAG: monovalent cation/H+ antiporter subunit A [Burkholderiaceae bacterium]|nr:MAG: monovalent cation/H+ antiporter subunit A [Burkholderiaceae bacterium]TAM02977.1 MAG: monovalent cation/H+ antiporter subunit A [Pusillimonas sp.]